MSGNPFYSREDISKIVSYAGGKGMQVIPEFEMPGHCDGWGYFFPKIVSGRFDRNNPVAEFNLTYPDTYRILAHFLVEFMPLFSDGRVHLGADEVSGSWPDSNPNQTFTNFENIFILNLVKAFKKTPILWEDPITEKGLAISKEFTIQLWRDSTSVSSMLSKGYKTIISTANTWYIGNATPEKINAYTFPNNSLLKGAELVWFTSQGDDPNDLSWLVPVIRAAGIKMAA
jgi:hexosaminidase